jgi:hypothetical protein
MQILGFFAMIDLQTPEDLTHKLDATQSSRTSEIGW